MFKHVLAMTSRSSGERSVVSVEISRRAYLVGNHTCPVADSGQGTQVSIAKKADEPPQNV